MVKKAVKFDLSEACGWVGMVMIHAATLPTSLGVILGYSDKLPPLSMVLMVWSGLFLFLVRALGRNDKLYIISNAVGFFFIYRDWETDRKSTRLNSSHSAKSRMPSSA